MSGDVLCGTVGDGDRLEFTVVGDAVNQAVKLEKANKTFRTLARLTGAAPYSAGLRVPRELRMESLEQLIGFVSRIECDALAELQGVSPARAHQVPAGAAVAAASMRLLDVPFVRICPWALREGVILRRLDSLEGA